MGKDKRVEILLAEDSDQDAELTLRALKKNNVLNEIVRVKNGEEALDFLFCKGIFEGREQKNKPKLILLDLKMPKVDGLEVLKAIRGSETTKTLPVVMLTSSKEEKDIVESYKLGVNSYIVKPVDFISFMHSVQDIGKYWLVLNERPL